LKTYTINNKAEFTAAINIFDRLSPEDKQKILKGEVVKIEMSDKNKEDYFTLIDCFE